MKKLAIAAAAVVLAALAWWFLARPRESGMEPRNADAGDVRHASFVESEARLDVPDHELADASARRTEPTEIANSRAVPSGLLIGRVLWLPDRAPAVGIGVRIRSASYHLADGDPPLAVTDDEGRFRVESVTIGPCWLELDRADVRTQIQVIAGENPEVALETPRGVDVAGRVLDMHGEPRAGAEIVLSESSWSCSRVVTVSAPDGSYRLTGLGRKTAIHARARGAEPSAQRTVDPKLGKTLAIDLQLGATPGGIRGRVIDVDGRPRANEVVRFTPPSGSALDSRDEWLDHGPLSTCTTDAEGGFEAFDVPTGPVQLHVLRRGPAYAFTSTVVEVRPDRVANVTITVPASARVHGRVLAHDGSAISGARVTANAIDGTARVLVRTAKDGEFAIADAPAGHVRLSANHDAHDDVWAEFQLAPGGAIEWNPRSPALSAIRGRLVDAASKPIVAANVQCEPGRRNAATDSEGRFEIANLPSRPHAVRYATKQVYVVAEVVPGSPEIVLVAAPPNARVFGRIVDVAGRAQAGMHVRCADSRTTSGADGTFELRAVRSGRHAVFAVKFSKPGTGTSALVTVDVVANGSHDLGDVLLPEFGALRIRGKSAEGVSLAWVRAQLRRVGELEWRPTPVKSVVFGEWNFDTEPVGDYEVLVTGGGAASELLRATIEAGQTTEIELDVRFGVTLRGEVRSAEPQHAAGIVAIRYGGRPPIEVATSDWNSSGRIATFSICILPGRHEVIATLPDGRSGSTTCVVPSDGSPPPLVSIEVR